MVGKKRNFTTNRREKKIKIKDSEYRVTQGFERVLGRIQAEIIVKVVRRWRCERL